MRKANEDRWFINLTGTEEGGSKKKKKKGKRGARKRSGLVLAHRSKFDPNLWGKIKQTIPETCEERGVSAAVSSHQPNSL